MNVLYVLGTFPKLSESFVLSELYELDRRGHEVAVCALNRPTEEITHREFDRLDVPIGYVDRPAYTDVPELVSEKTLNPSVLRQAGYRAPVRTHAANLLRAKRCLEFVETLDWEVEHVHTHFARRSRFAALFVASYLGVPFTVTTHAADLYSQPVKPCTGTLLRSADRIVTISEYNRRHVRAEFAEDTPIDVVRAGISPEKFDPSGPTVDGRVLTVGRFVEKKGWPYALGAIARVAEELPDLQYHVVGSGDLEPELHRIVERRGIESTVTFLDNVDDDRLLRELDEAQCFLLPCVVAASGDRDGIPVAIMEAMAMETPPVSTTVSGIPELVAHERNGLLVEPRDVAAASRAVRRMLSADEQRRTYARRARETVRREFDVAEEVDALVESFERAGGRDRPAPEPLLQQ